VLYQFIIQFFASNKQWLISIFKFKFFEKLINNGLKLGVIGEPCIDYIHREGMETRKHFGGILYSAVSLAVIAKDTDEIYPIMNLGNDEYVNVISFLKKFKNIKTDFIYRSLHKTRVVKLYYKSGSSTPVCGGNNTKKTYDREESSTQPTLPVSIDQIKVPSFMMDSILVNMVSGMDIGFDTLQSLRRNFRGYIHMDLHNVVMKTNKNGTRTQGPVKKWLTWCTNCDTLQMNESEINVLSGEGLSEYETAEKILNSGNVRSITITRGKNGVSLYEQKMNGEPGIEKNDFFPVITPKFQDSTGCGDVFASGFFYKLCESNLNEPITAIHYANKLASRNSELIGVEELKKLDE